MTDESSKLSVLESFSVSDGSKTVDVRKVSTGKGERLELSDPEAGTSILIDALALESLCWQAPDNLGKSLGFGESADFDDEVKDDAVDQLDSFTILNEFAEADVSTFRTNGTDVLEINALKLGYTIRLTPSLLAAISEQNIELFTNFLETPYGPEEH